MHNTFRRATSGAILWIATLTSAVAQDWPSRNVTVILPLPAGVASDVISRVVFEQVGKQVGQTFVIENRPGAGGTIGASLVAKAAPDGHTILVYGSIAAANALYKQLPYDTVNDFTPTVLFGQTPLVVITGAGRYKTLGELVSAAKAKPGQLNYSTVGVGSAAHFGAERLAVSAGFTAQHIPFRTGEWLTEIIAGRIDFAVRQWRPRSAPSVTASSSRSRPVLRRARCRCQTYPQCSRPDSRPTRSIRLHGRVSSGCDTARHCRETARRGDEGPGGAGRAGAAGRDRRRSDADDTRRVRCVLQKRRCR